MSLAAIKRELRGAVNPEKAAFLPKFFKAMPGGYGEGDHFLGVTVPNSRRIAKKYRDLEMAGIEKLITSKWHEERMVATLLLVHRYEKGDDAERRAVYQFYLDHFAGVNNWDLVDGSAPQILGGHLLTRSRKPLRTWAKSPHLWVRRRAMLATYTFIKNGEFDDTLELAEQLLADEHDLMHKAVGWMLREVGNRDRKPLEAFLQQHYAQMPRTMLRYAIEKLPEKRRQAYLKGKV